MLDTDDVTVILDDGRKFTSKLVGADPRLELAVLKIEAADLPFFDLSKSLPAAEGTRVLAFSNLFGVATGEEPASVLHGTISAVTTLDARRGAYETPYQGPIYALDAMTNNPGAAGGALTDLQGHLLGVLGKELRNARNNVWLNFAIPTPELTSSIEAIRSGKNPANTKEAKPKKPDNPLTLARLGSGADPERFGPHAAVRRRCSSRLARRVGRHPCRRSDSAGRFASRAIVRGGAKGIGPTREPTPRSG